MRKKTVKIRTKGSWRYMTHFGMRRKTGKRKKEKEAFESMKVIYDGMKGEGFPDDFIAAYLAEITKSK